MKSTAQLFIFLLLGAMAISASMHFLDEKVALEIWHFTSSHQILNNKINKIPNTLPILVAVGTVFFWLAYYAVVHINGKTNHTQFIQLAATSVPLAFLIKLFLQFAFGRSNIRLWLRVGGPIDFRWFNPVENGGFPSGHALVFTALFTAVWLHYPRYRPLSVAAVALLGAALLLTSYHFVSDIIAGICCGILITAGVHHFYAKYYRTSD